MVGPTRQTSLCWYRRFITPTKVWKHFSFFTAMNLWCFTLQALMCVFVCFLQMSSYFFLFTISVLHQTWLNSVDNSLSLLSLLVFLSHTHTHNVTGGLVHTNTFSQAQSSYMFFKIKLKNRCTIHSKYDPFLITV